MFSLLMSKFILRDVIGCICDSRNSLTLFTCFFYCIGVNQTPYVSVVCPTTANVLKVVEIYCIENNESLV
uniref:Putative secreted protein n=1 Tax=Rhipicephalus microplus TaxID=6941 RepID=A0A6M2DB90_RHIMP